MPLQAKDSILPNVFSHVLQKINYEHMPFGLFGKIINFESHRQGTKEEFELDLYNPMSTIQAQPLCCN